MKFCFFLTFNFCRIEMLFKYDDIQMISNDVNFTILILKVEEHTQELKFLRCIEKA